MADILDLVGRLEIGTRIRFNKDLIEPARGDHPTLLYAYKGEIGTITGYGSTEGYWVKSQNNQTVFGAGPDEFDVFPHNAEANRPER